MSASRIRFFSPVALLLALLVAMGAVWSPAGATATRTLTLRASATVVGTGTSVTFSGTLAPTPTGSSLRLQVKGVDSWLDARTLKTTNADGAYRISVDMPTYLGTYYFRTIASAYGGRSAATSRTVAITVLHKVTASLKASTTSVGEGGTVRFTGHVSSCLVGGTVTLQRFTSSGWAKVTTATLSSKCNYLRDVRPVASTTYRLSVPRHGSYAPAYSPNVRITYTGPAPTPPVITTSSLPDGSVGTAYSQTLTKTGASGTWSRTSGSLPPGLTLTGSTGKISGTPSAGGTFNFTVRFTETATALSSSKALSITVVSGPAITTSALPDGKRGDPYSFTLTKTGAAGTWSALHLPSGITLDQSTGQISGTPVVEGDWVVAATFTETVSGKTANKSLPLHIATSPPPVINTTTLADGVKNVAYNQTLSVTGNAGTWAVTAGALPPGVSLNPSTGALTGTPTTADDYPFTVTFTETAAQTTDSQGLLLHVSPAANSPTIDTVSLAGGTVGTSYADQLHGSGAGTWSITKLSLPPGLSLNGLTGQITGTPTLSGTYVFQVKYTTLTGSNTKLLSIQVAPAS